MKLGFIGCGNLAQAIISGLILKKTIKPQNIFARSRNLNNIKKFSQKNKIKICKTNQEVALNADIIFLATKPQDLAAALKEVKQLSAKKIIISLAAGVKVESIKKNFKSNPVARVMATLSAKIQSGVYGIYFFNCSQRDKKIIIKLFSSIGTPIVCKNQGQIDAITAGSASGVGFVFELMRLFQSWFIKNGFTLHHARLMAVETFLGAAKMAKHEKRQLEGLRNAVTSKKGTTLAGLKSMKNSKIDKKITKALTDSKSRAKELSKNF
ncbi:MAG: pyrroline-5-carboxylate reductase [Oligoflexia bacterium]|nr:pyrroline-5-carboxylate reductase [Oligoflexia bacterium]